MGEIEREDIQRTVFSEKFKFDEFVSLITKHMEIQIPEELGQPDKKDELVDFVYNTYVDQSKKEELPDGETIDGETVDEVEPKEEPEIKIDLNLGSATDEPQPLSADEGGNTPSTEPEAEVEEEKVEIETPQQDIKDTSSVLSDESDESEVVASVPPASVSNSSPPFADRKSHIIALVKQSKWTLKQIVQIIDDDWGYAANGKSSKTRVSKTVKTLRDSNLLYEESNGILMWRGEG